MSCSICVPTPVDEDLRPDRAPARRLRGRRRHARPGQTIVLTTTTYVGTTRELLVEPLAERGLIVGRGRVRRLLARAHRPRQRAPRAGAACRGSSAASPRPARGAPRRCSRAPPSACTAVSSPEAAEMVKLYENTFRAVNIALANEMAEACRRSGSTRSRSPRRPPPSPTASCRTGPAPGSAGTASPSIRTTCWGRCASAGGPRSLAEEALRRSPARPRARGLARARAARCGSGRPLRARACWSWAPPTSPASPTPARRRPWRSSRGCAREGAQVDYHDPLVPSFAVDGGRPAALHVGARGGPTSGAGRASTSRATTSRSSPRCTPSTTTAGWRAARAVLDCTYRTPGGLRRLRHDLAGIAPPCER